MSPKSIFNELPLETVVVLARHVCRVLGSVSLKQLVEHFPSLDIETNLKILERLLNTGHLRKSGHQTYAVS